MIYKSETVTIELASANWGQPPALKIVTKDTSDFRGGLVYISVHEAGPLADVFQKVSDLGVKKSKEAT